MLTDMCNNCHAHKHQCSCQQDTPEPCLPNSGECDESVNLACTFWMGTPVPGTPIKKGVRGTEIVFYLLALIRDLQQRVNDLENP